MRTGGTPYFRKPSFGDGFWMVDTVPSIKKNVIFGMVLSLDLPNEMRNMVI